MGVLSKFRRKGKGFQDKTRTGEEINQDYNHHAVMYGHTTVLIAENEKIRDHHLAAMIRLRDEAKKVPAKAEQKSEEPKTEGPTA